MRGQPPPAPEAGPAVRLETAHYIVRTLTPQDADDAWLQWVSDAEIMRPINSPVVNISRQQLQSYIRAVDRRNVYLFGIFDKLNGTFVGFHEMKVNSLQRTAVFNVMIGDRSYWGKDVVLETRGALLDFFFEERGIEKAVGKPLARNFPMIYNYKKQGWQHEGTLRGQCKSNYGPGRLDQYQFGLLRDEWRRMKTSKQGNIGDNSVAGP
jgi:RimJ/RimL family protein N-acetyltransferase